MRPGTEVFLVRETRNGLLNCDSFNNGQDPVWVTLRLLQFVLMALQGIMLLRDSNSDLYISAFQVLLS